MVHICIFQILFIVLHVRSIRKPKPSARDWRERRSSQRCCKRWWLFYGGESRSIAAAGGVRSSTRLKHPEEDWLLLPALLAVARARQVYEFRYRWEPCTSSVLREHVIPAWSYSSRSWSCRRMPRQALEGRLREHIRLEEDSNDALPPTVWWWDNPRPEDLVGHILFIS